jgi:hypothetical protein
MLNSIKKVDYLFVAPPYCQTECCARLNDYSSIPIILVPKKVPPKINTESIGPINKENISVIIINVYPQNIGKYLFDLFLIISSNFFFVKIF